MKKPKYYFLHEPSGVAVVAKDIRNAAQLLKPCVGKEFLPILEEDITDKGIWSFKLFNSL